MNKQSKWQLVEFKNTNESGLLCTTAPEGHKRYTGSGTVDHFVITTEMNPDKSLYGSFVGLHVAELPIAYQGRTDALANARLIAAAPDLLAACEIAYNITNDEFFCKLFQDIIAKATGEKV